MKKCNDVLARQDQVLQRHTAEQPCSPPENQGSSQEDYNYEEKDEEEEPSPVPTCYLQEEDEKEESL